MQSSYRLLRSTLLTMFAVHLAFAYIFLFDPGVLSRLYGDIALDNMHLFLSRGFGALLVALAVGAFYAFLHPAKSGGLVLVLILSHFSVFLSDVVTLAREQMALTVLLPEMAYNLVMATLLIRFFPSGGKEEAGAKEEKAGKVKKDEPAVPETDGNPLDAVREPLEKTEGRSQ